MEEKDANIDLGMGAKNGSPRIDNCNYWSGFSWEILGKHNQPVSTAIGIVVCAHSIKIEILRYTS